MGGKKISDWKHISVIANAEQKAVLQEAAAASGLSLSAFLLRQGLKEASEALERPLSTEPEWAVRKGPGGYENKGWLLAVESWFKLTGVLPPAEVASAHADLKRRLEGEDRLEIWLWLQRHFPAVAKTVPERRQLAFVRGMIQASKQGLVLGAKIPAQ